MGTTYRTSQLPRPGNAIALVSAFKSHTGSTMVARCFAEVLRGLGHTLSWYQCVSSRRRSEYDLGDCPINGLAFGPDPLNTVVNSLFVFPARLEKLTEGTVFLTDPILLAAAGRVGRSVLVVHDVRELGPYRRSRLAAGVYRTLFRHINKVERIVCVSNATREALIGSVDPRPPIDVIYPFARVTGDPALHLARSLTRAEQGRELRLTYVAADRPYKNIAFLARLAKSLGDSPDGIRLRVSLVSRLRPPTKHMLREIGAQNLDVVPEVPDTTPVYEETDILVHPSSTEGFGVPLAEAMQFGIPIVASDDPAIREVVGSGGIIAPVGDLGAWRDAIVGLLRPERLREAAVASARRGDEFRKERFETRVATLMAALDR